ncbi:DUF4340 domain-containing protein [Paradevosia shaoguanensis]|uniref:DUF4340 domain-containing protein n=1 Tax=Paradevosia shaoguanensis TaxID=1335043 RepID=UPI003C7917CF
MQQKSIILWAGVAVIALLGAAWAVSSEGMQQGPASVASLLPDLQSQATNVAGVKVRTAAYEIDIQKQGDKWVATSQEGYPVRDGTAQQLVSAVVGFKPVEAKTRDADWYAQIGVDDPATAGSSAKAVSLLDSQGKPIEDIIIGNLSELPRPDSSMATYVRLPSSDEAVLVQGTALLPMKLADWFGELFSIPGSQVARVAITEQGKPALSAKRGEDGRFVRETVDPQYETNGTFVNDAAIKRVTQGLASVSIMSVRPAKEGISPIRSIDFEVEPGVTIHAQIADATQPLWVRFSAEATKPEGKDLADKISARVNGWEFQLEGARVNAFTTPVANLMQKDSEPIQFEPGQSIDLQSIPGLMQGGAR